MAYNAIKYHNWYNTQNYDRITFFVPKGTRENIKKHAKEQGLSTNRYLMSLVPKSLIKERGKTNDE